MTASPSQDTASPEAAIVDLVFAGEPRGTWGRLVVGCLSVATLYMTGFVAISRLGRSAGPWTAEMAARIHDALAVERALDVIPPPPEPPPPPSTEMPTIQPARVARAARSPRPAPSAPAQAAQVVAAASAPADFTGLSFVVGSGSTYAGGTTTAAGTSRAPVTGPVAPTTAGARAPVRTRARSVTLDEAAWSCPWPAEADAQQVNEQTVVLRAAVRVDGRVEHVEVLADPGFGFGAAARLCALSTRFAPARDPAGQPVAALSPPIRVHFFR